MNPTLNALFDEPEKRYLSADDLNLLSQYVALCRSALRSIANCGRMRWR
jgi:hypothetical protein